MIYQGKIQSVENFATGACLVGAHLTGVSSLTLDDATEFVGADQVQIGPNIYSVMAVGVEDSYVLISTGLLDDQIDGAEIYVYPISEQKRALVQMGDDDEPIVATVPHSLYDNLPDGFRDVDEQESVTLVQERQEWVIQDVVDLVPLLGQRVATAQGTADEALTSANGKNAITHTDYAPTNEENTLGDTWFVHDTVDGTIVAQYTGMGGTSWVPTQISHQVIASVDLGTATVGKLTANYIDTGVLSAALTLTGYIVAGNPEGARVVIDTDGIRQYDADGNILINLPTDPEIPSQFEGAVIADSLTIKDFMSLQGLANEIARGAVVTVAGGTSAPLTAPSVAVGYQSYDTGRFTSGSVYIPRGMHADVDDSPDVLGAATFYGYGKLFSRTNKWWVGSAYTDSEGSSRTRYGNIWSSTAVWVSGAERIVFNGIYTTGAGSVPAGRLTSVDPSTMTNTGSVAPTQKAQLNARKDDYIYYMRLGRVLGGLSGTQFPERIAMALFNYQAPNVVVGQITLRQYTVTDNATLNAGFTQVGSDLVVASPLAAGETLIGVTYGRSDKLKMTAAGTDFTWLLHGSVKTYAYNTSGARVTDYDFNTPAGASTMQAFGDLATGGFIGFRTTTWADNTPITKLTNNHWLTGTSGKWWFSSTNYDGDITGGTHETAQGPRASLNVPKRAGIVMTVPPYPARPFPTTTDDPTASRLYIGRGSSDPGRTYMERVGQLSSPTRTLAVGDLVFPVGTAASPPPASSNFPASSPGKLVSADGASWVLSGDGKATFAGVEFDGAKPGLKSTIMRIQDSGFAGTSQTTTSTALVQHPNGPTISVVAPPSGVISIDAVVYGKISVAPYFMFASVLCRLNNISGTLIDTQTVFNNYNDWIRASGKGLFTGLTPGSTYFFYLAFATSNASGTASISQSRLIATPSP